MAKAYLDQLDRAFTLDNPNTYAYGQIDFQSVTLTSNANNIVIDQNIEEIIFPKASSEYTYKQTGNQLKIYLSGALIATVAVQGDDDGTKFTFANGSANAVLGADGVMKIGGASSTATTEGDARGFDSSLVISAPILTPAPDPTPSPPPAPPAPPPSDTTAPTLASQTPTDDAVEVAINANIVLTMSENVTAVTGKNITIKKTSDNSTVATIDAADAQVGVAANVVTVNPTSDLAKGIEYYVLIDSGAFKDSANNNYAGISSTTELSFTTVLSSNVLLSDIAVGIGGFSMPNGSSASTAGDVNGDGLADLIVGVSSSDSNAGKSYVIFGKSNGATVSPADIASGIGGFVINGEAAGDESGFSVSTAGDVNGDGLADLIIGAPYNDAVSSNMGRSYVVFGKSNTTAVNLANIATGVGGFAINGEVSGDISGQTVSATGDVNGDGLADLIIGARQNDTTGSNAGRSYVVFGKSDTTTVSLTTIAAGTGGFAINGEAAGNQSGAVTSAGDVNGDGLADIVVISPYSDKSYVVFGKSDGGVVNLSALGTGGFLVNGEASGDYKGFTSSAGDINGDGLADLLFNHVYDDFTATDAGRGYVVFGKSDTATVELSAIATGVGGFVINGEAEDDRSGGASGAGDINGDGLADLIIGAPYNDVIASNAGRSYIVFGKSSTASVNLSSIAAGTGGFAISGEALGDLSGYPVSAAGDVNGDGLSDLIITASGVGKTYVIFGGSQWLTTSVTGSGTITGTAAAEALIGSSSSDTLTGGGGIDRFYSGNGADVIVLTSSDITNLADNTTGSAKRGGRRRRRYRRSKTIRRSKPELDHNSQPRSCRSRRKQPH